MFTQQRGRHYDLPVNPPVYSHQNSGAQNTANHTPQCDTHWLTSEVQKDDVMLKWTAVISVAQWLRYGTSKWNFSGGVQELAGHWIWYPKTRYFTQLCVLVY